MLSSISIQSSIGLCCIHLLDAAPRFHSAFLFPGLFWNKLVLDHIALAALGHTRRKVLSFYCFQSCICFIANMLDYSVELNSICFNKNPSFFSLLLTKKTGRTEPCPTSSLGHPPSSSASGSAIIPSKLYLLSAKLNDAFPNISLKSW